MSEPRHNHAGPAVNGTPKGKCPACDLWGNWPERRANDATVPEAPWAKGDRVVLVRCTDTYTKLSPGSGGTVRLVDDMGTVHVDWDDGHRLGMVEEAGDVIRRE